MAPDASTLAASPSTKGSLRANTSSLQKAPQGHVPALVCTKGKLCTGTPVGEQRRGAEPSLRPRCHPGTPGPGTAAGGGELGTGRAPSGTQEGWVGGCPGGWVPGWVGTQLNSPAMPCPSAPCGAKRSPGTGATTQPCPQKAGGCLILGQAPSTEHGTHGTSSTHHSAASVPVPPETPGHWGLAEGHTAAQPPGGKAQRCPSGPLGTGGSRGRPRGAPSAVPPAPGAQRGQPRAAQPRCAPPAPSLPAPPRARGCSAAPRRLGTARLGKARLGKARLGWARPGAASPGRAGSGLGVSSFPPPRLVYNSGNE